MIWVDREAKRIKEKNLVYPEGSRREWADDMKTPSGRIHVGSLRGVVVHDLIYKALKQIDVNAKFSYVFNDMDPMDGMPTYLDKNKWQKYMGFPLYRIPSPEPGFKSFADYFAQEFIEVFNSINCHPQIIWSSELHRSGKMNDVIKTILDQTEKIRDIFKKVYKKPKPADWFPYNPICSDCGKVGTTKVYKWDGKYVYYRCEKSFVTWAQGCGHEDKVEPVNENGKLVWRLDWPAHWKVIGVTIESSGKDHMSKGGSYDTAERFCREILNYSPPDALGGYEWFTIGGKKMSSSKGIGNSAKEVSEILPPEIFRFLQVRTPIKTHLDFNPFGNTIPDLFDDYDRCLNAFFLKLENKIPPEKEGEVTLDFARIAELSEVNPLPKKRIYLPRFRTIANLLKTGQKNLVPFFEKQKTSPLTSEEKTLLNERIKYAKIYLEKYAEENQPYSFGATASKLSFKKSQIDFLKVLSNNLKLITSTHPQSVKETIFNTLKSTNITPREAFTTFYQVLTGKNFGPKAEDLIQKLGINNVIDLITRGISNKEEKVSYLYPVLNNPDIFSISPEMAKKYPTLNIGIAIIKGVTIKKNDSGLANEIEKFVKSQENLTNEEIGNYPEIQSYRKIYKEMGIDWHSKRPSPEALLRRLARKKGLYQINTCVDAYNLIVMKRRASSGAFDLDQIKLPTVLRFPKPGEEILLLGDEQPTKYNSSDLAYFDQIGGYNLYFNYRDAQRTAVTEKTKNILLNIDGIYDISREKVEQALKENIEIILKYCGGKVELAGIVSASLWGKNDII